MYTGIFIKEAKERFIGYVKIDSQIEECYISSSSHLHKLICLKNKKVILTENKGKNLRTKYTVQAVIDKNNTTLINLNYVNSFVYEYLKSKYPNIDLKRECYVGSYKSDFYLPSKNKIIEVKSLLSKTKTTKFPSVHGIRSIKQLQKIYQLLKDGYNVDYYIVLLSSVIQNIISDNEKKSLIIYLNCA